MLTRRHVLAGAAAASSLAPFAPALGKAPFAPAQAPGIHRRRIGAIEVTTILDGVAPLGAQLFSGRPAAELKAVLAASGMTESLPTSVNAFVVNTGDKTWLLDAGLGANQAFGPNLGRVEANLRAAGIDPAQIDGIILTHAHADHCEGLINAAGAARFPNAELVIHEAEAAFWADDGIMSRAPAEAKPFFESARKSLAPYAARTRKVKAGQVAPGLVLEHAPGHTPGHSVLRVTSGSEQLLLIGDIMHNTAIHTALPDAGFAFDGDPAMAAASRKRIFDMISADGMLVAGTHVGFPGFGRVLRSGQAYRWVPAEWAYTL